MFRGAKRERIITVVNLRNLSGFILQSWDCKMQKPWTAQTLIYTTHILGNDIE